MRLTQIIEALLFASDAPLSAADLSRVDERLDEDTVEAVIQELRAEYELSERSFQIYEVAGGFQLLTRPEFVSVLERYDSVPQPARLSAPALEVLAIIAYRQPIGRTEIEEIRGVGSSGVLRTLTERNLVEPVARGEGLGRPLLYGTTKKFLEHFGFRSLEDLPRPDELPVVLRERPSLEGIEPLAGVESSDGVAAESAPTAAPTDANAAEAIAPGGEAEPATSEDGESVAAPPSPEAEAVAVAEAVAGEAGSTRTAGDAVEEAASAAGAEGEPDASAEDGRVAASPSPEAEPETRAEGEAEPGDAPDAEQVPDEAGAARGG